MNKTISIATICLLVLLISQGYWLYETYTDFKEKEKLVIQELFNIAIDNESGIRFSDSPKDPHNLKFTIKSAEDMTPEERASLKSDTLDMDEVAKKNIGKGFSQIFTQKVQDVLIDRKPLRPEMLDTLFNIELEKKKIYTTYLITLYNKDHQVIEQVDHAYDKNKDYILTELYPIGTQGRLFVQAQVALPPYIIFQQMMYAFIISILIIGITFYCVGRQLYIIRRTRRQLKEREESIYGTIHDLKKPLNGVFSTLDFMQQTEKDTDILSIIKNSKKQIRKLTDTIESMLYDLKSEFQTNAIQAVAVDLPATIRQIETELNPSFRGKKYTFKIENPDQIQTIQTDAVRLERCLRNLIENALKYSDEGVTVCVRLSAHDGQCCIAVQDNGWGIPRNAQKRIGKQFFRVKRNNKPQQEGYGIGLNSVNRLVRELGGTFTFESKENSGSIFFIILPS